MSIGGLTRFRFCDRVLSPVVNNPSDARSSFQINRENAAEQTTSTDPPRSYPLFATPLGPINPRLSGTGRLKRSW